MRRPQFASVQPDPEPNPVRCMLCGARMLDEELPVDDLPMDDDYSVLTCLVCGNAGGLFIDVPAIYETRQPTDAEDKRFRLALRRFIQAAYQLGAVWTNEIDDHRINHNAYELIFRMPFDEIVHDINDIYAGPVSLYHDVREGSVS